MSFGKMSEKLPGPQRQPHSADRNQEDSAQVNSRQRPLRRRYSASRLAVGVICLSPLLGTAENGDRGRRHAAERLDSNVEVVATA